MKLWHRWLMGALLAVAMAVTIALVRTGEQGSLAAGDIIYVDADATGLSNGETWGDAFTTLQPALDKAITGDQIWVAEGTYRPTSGSDRYASFQMANGVGIYGGFVGTEEFLGERDWVKNLTILSGDIGTPGDPSDNSYHVFYHPAGTDLDVGAILDGFTITGGYADGEEDPHREGGGMYNDSSSPVLRNVTFAGNWAEERGGGIYNFRSSPELTDCTFGGNETYYDAGGGIYNYDKSSPELTDCTFKDNSAGSYGGGIHNEADSSPAVSGCTFTGNSAEYSGGAICNDNSSPAVSGCDFESNSARNGGAIYNCNHSSPTLTGSDFPATRPLPPWHSGRA